jgi:replicative DNA helicase
MLHVLNILSKASLESYLIVFDSSKNFMSSGKDRDSNRDVSEFLSIIKIIRDNGATVLLLHHVNKPQKDMDLIFAGAAAWLEDVSSAFMLRQNRWTNCFILKPVKERVGSLQEVAFTFSKSENMIESCDLFLAKETEESEEIRKTISNFIKNNEKPSYTQILEYCMDDCGFSKNKVNSVIQTSKDHYWKAIKEQKKNNRDVYILLDN